MRAPMLVMALVGMVRVSMLVIRLVGLVRAAMRVMALVGMVRAVMLVIGQVGSVRVGASEHVRFPDVCMACARDDTDTLGYSICTSLSP